MNQIDITLNLCKKFMTALNYAIKILEHRMT